MTLQVREFPYHTITVCGAENFLHEVDTVMTAFALDCDYGDPLHVSIDWPPDSEPVYRFSISGLDAEGEYNPVEFFLALVYDIAEKADVQDKYTVSSYTSWHPTSLEPGKHAADYLMEELLITGSYEFLFPVPEFFPMTLFDQIIAIIIEETLRAEHPDVEFGGWGATSLPGGQISVTIYGRPPLHEQDFEARVGAAVQSVLDNRFITNWMSDNYYSPPDYEEEDTA